MQRTVQRKVMSHHMHQSVCSDMQLSDALQLIHNLPSYCAILKLFYVIQVVLTDPEKSEESSYALKCL